MNKKTNPYLKNFARFLIFEISIKIFKKKRKNLTNL